VFVPLFWLSFSCDGGILCSRSFGKFKRLSLRQKDNFCLKFISDYGLYVHFSAKYSLFGMVLLLSNVLFYSSTMSYNRVYFFRWMGDEDVGPQLGCLCPLREGTQISLLINVYFYLREFWCFENRLQDLDFTAYWLLSSFGIVVRNAWDTISSLLYLLMPPYLSRPNTF
jgi:hypothetical protein